jgi:hypothetical protein
MAVYRPAFRVGFYLDAAILIFTSLLLDMGAMQRAFRIPMIAHWAAVVLIVARRPFSPTRIDRILVAFGTFVFLAITMLLAAILK